MQEAVGAGGYWCRRLLVQEAVGVVGRCRCRKL